MHPCVCNTLLPAPGAGLSSVGFLVRPLRDEGRERDSGDTPETPPGAAPLDPAFKKPLLVSPRAGPIFGYASLWLMQGCKVAIKYACYGSRDKVLVPGHYSRFVAQ